ncbi:hypothetical protein H8356DRAFT_1439050 [Neocallimastix lanati (nom. inval.)]|nr:hypothetical protein H8356DRAFT_1439050 [Neocallimastix sp. JGI-2020a]
MAGNRINSLFDSDDENYREASKNLQHNLYYEEETLNIIINLSIRKKNENEINKKYYEHEFHFTNVEQKFASDTIINTYIYCLEDYKSLKESTIHQITKMFIELQLNAVWNLCFLRILSEKEILPNSQSFRELYEFINYIVNNCLEIKYGSEYFDTNKEEVEKKYNSDDEIEVKAGLSKNEKLSVAISLLKENKKEQYIQWIKDQENTDYVIEPEDDNQKTFNEFIRLQRNKGYELMETRKLIILYENDPIELLSKKPASKLIRKVKKRGQRKRVTHRKSNGNGKGSEVITTDLSAPYILDEKDNTSDSDDDEAFNAFLKREAELRQRTYEKHEKIIEEENEKRSQALLKREKILKNIETKINNNKKSRKTRSRQSTDPIEIPDGNNALKSIEIEDDNNDDQIETIISPKPTKKKLLKLSEMNIISDEDDDYEEDTTTNDNKNISQELKLNDNLTTTSTNKNQNIGIAFESDTESDSDFEFQFKSLQESLSNKKESETETDILKLTTLDTTHTDNNTSNIMEFKDFTNSDINNNKRKIDESNDIKEIENNIENIQINSKKRKKMLIVESDSESD